MKPTLLILLLSCVGAMSQQFPFHPDNDYIPDLDFDNAVVNLASDLMLDSPNLHKDTEALRYKLGMPDQGSDRANVNKIGDWMCKQVCIRHNFKSWKEFSDYEANGCSFVYTNLTTEATIQIHLEEITNWTGVVVNGKELGYISTNHIASIVYQDATNDFVLKMTASDRAVWRIKYDAQWEVQNYFETNCMIVKTNRFYNAKTNSFEHNPRGDETAEDISYMTNWVKVYQGN